MRLSEPDRRLPDPKQKKEQGKISVLPRRQFLILAAGTAALLAGCAPVVSEAEQSLPQIVVGCDNYPPFNTVGTSSGYAGIDVELAREAFHRLGYEPVFQLIKWEEKDALLESGEIDCVWSCFGMQDRKGEYRWAGPYMTSREVVAVLPESDIRTLVDLAGRSVAVQSATHQEQIFLHPEEDPRIPEVQMVFTMEDRELLYPLLGKGYVDAVASHDLVVLQFMKDYSVEYRILDEALETAELGVAFAKDNTSNLPQMLDNTLSAMQQDGTIRSILARYVDDPDALLEVSTRA